MDKQIKILIEKHPDGDVPYPSGLKGVAVGQGDTFDEALLDAKSATAFQVARFGADVLENAPDATQSYFVFMGRHCA